MDYPIRLLRYFIAVAEDGSFTQAGTKLNASQPVVSCGIRRLEKMLGFRLLERSSRHVELTVEGHSFLPKAQSVIAACDEAGEMAQKLRSGGSREFRVGYPPYMIDVPELEMLLEHFPKRFPAVSLKVHMSLSSSLLVEMQHRRLDVALVIGFPETFGIDTLLLRRIYTELLLPSEHPLARKKMIGLDDLEGLEIWTSGRHHAASFFDTTIAPLARCGAIVRPAMNPSFVGLVHSARKHRTVSVAFDTLTPKEDIALGDVVVRPIEGRIGWTDLLLARPHGSPNVAADLLWEYARSKSPSRLSDQRLHA